jgi:hypothetical protein
VGYVRELARLLVKVALAFVVALGLAAAQAPFRGGGFVHGLRVSCFVVGTLLLLMATIGRDNPFDRAMDYGVTRQAWGVITGVSTLRRVPEDPTLTPGAVFGLSGLALVVLGTLI